VLEEAAKVFMELCIRTLWEAKGNIAEELEKHKNLIMGASRHYVRSYYERHGALKVLGMREPVSLEDVYTSTLVRDDRAIYRFESITKLEENYRERGDRRFDPDIPGQSGIEVARRTSYLMVLGGPGAGKSTFLSKVGLEALKGRRGQYGSRWIPVFIELKNFIDTSVEIKSLIVDEFQNCKFPGTKEFVELALERGRLLILLDGMDEIPPNVLDNAIDKIQNFVDRFDKNRFIVSCRMAAYKRGFRRFTDVAMADFNDSQIEKFINNWFRSENDKRTATAQKCWEILQKPKNAAAKELAHTPLLLTFLCLVYDKSQTFPDNRGVLYRKALRILLEEWAAEKRIMRDQIYEGLSIEQEEILLSEIACRGFQENTFFFSQKEIVEQIKNFLEGNLNAPEHLDGEGILDAIAIQQGILVKRAEDVFSFSHLTLQEYLTAQYIDDYRRIEPLVDEYLTDERWREVFLLVAGLIREGADELLRLMAEQAQALVKTPKLQALLEWADTSIFPSGDNSISAARRAAAVFLSRILIRDHRFNLLLASTFNRTLYEARVHDVSRALEVARANDIVLSRELILINLLSSTSDDSLIDALETYRINDLAPASLRIISGSFNLQEFFYNRATALVSKLEKAKIFVQDIDFIEFQSQLSEILGKNKGGRFSHTSIASRVRYRELADNIIQSWIETLRLNLDWMNLTEKEVSDLEKYCYITELIVRCRQVAMRVTPQTWQKIESQMFKPSKN